MSQVEIPLYANGHFPLVTVKIIFFQPEPSLIYKKGRKIPFTFLFSLSLMTHAMAFAPYF